MTVTVNSVGDNNTTSTPNPYRSVPLRYMGYANELGESFRPLIPVSFVHFSYVLAFGYVFADTSWVYSNAVARKQLLLLAAPTKAPLRPPTTVVVAPPQQEHSSSLSNFSPAVQAFDCLLWQTFASVFIPGYVIHSIVKAAGKLVEATADSSLFAKFPAGAMKTYAPTVVGLASIPLIIHPIDTAVEMAMENTIRKLYPNEDCD